MDYTSEYWELNLHIIDELEKRDRQRNKHEEISQSENRSLLTALEKSAEGETDQIKNHFESCFKINLRSRRTDLKEKTSLRTHD